jgi:hypothetical protein
MLKISAHMLKQRHLSYIYLLCCKIYRHARLLLIYTMMDVAKLPKLFKTSGTFKYNDHLYTKDEYKKLSKN